MNNPKSVTADELESELAKKQEWRQVRDTDASAAEMRCAAARARLNGFGVTRMFLVERGKELTTRRLAHASKWAERINSGERDLAPGAGELHALIQETNFVNDLLMKTTASLEPAARIDLLEAGVTLTGAWSDIRSLEADIHRLEVLRAGGAVAALEGSVEIKGAKSQELDRIAYAAVLDFESAKAALQTEQQIQEARRAKSTGAIDWQNPS
jgi:hypothetical protein